MASSLCVSVSVSPLLIRAAVILDLELTLILYGLILIELMTLTDTLFPNKVAFQDSEWT